MVRFLWHLPSFELIILYYSRLTFQSSIFAQRIIHLLTLMETIVAQLNKKKHKDMPAKDTNVMARTFADPANVAMEINILHVLATVVKTMSPTARILI